jgi:hypothetical protein
MIPLSSHPHKCPDLFDSIKASFDELQVAHNFPTTFGKSKMLRVLGEGSTSVIVRALHQQKGESYAIPNILL